MSASVTRRSALTATAAVLAGGVAGLLYGRTKHTTSAGPTTPGYGSVGASEPRTAFAPLTAVPVGGGLIKSGVVVTRTSGAVVHAFSSRCTHLGCTVNRVQGGKIFCPCHGSVFDATTGAVVQGPAPSPLPKIGVTVRNGQVFTS